MKDRTSRPPPGPTVYLVEEEEEGPAQEPSSEILESGDRRFHIIGEEVIDRDSCYTEEHEYLSDSFVLFPDRRRSTRHLPAFLLMPPIPFPELERLAPPEPIGRVVSVSPGPQTDVYLRSTLGFPRRSDYATILIGWDTGQTVGNR